MGRNDLPAAFSFQPFFAFPSRSMQPLHHPLLNRLRIPLLAAALLIAGCGSSEAQDAPSPPPGLVLTPQRCTAPGGSAASVVLRPADAAQGKRAVARPLGSTAAPFGYYERLPSRYADGSATRYPLIVFLHGSGEVRSQLAVLVGQDQPGVAKRDITAALDPDQAGGFVALFPQRCANIVVADEIRAFIDYAARAYRVDRSRVYLVGHSAGAAQIWSSLDSLTDLVAAVVPIAGLDVRADPCRAKQVPMWAFHAADDAIVPASHSVAVVNRLKACAPAAPVAPRLTLYPSGGHVVDTRTLDLSGMGPNDARHDAYDVDVYRWLLRHALPAAKP